jgi:hypothetical protein
VTSLLVDGAAERDLSESLAHLAEHGYARLGAVLTEDALARLRERADDVMLGRVPHEPFFFQHDAPSGEYGDLAFGRGWEGPSLSYRKIEKLERDPLFRELLENPLFGRLARARTSGGVALYRAVLFTKDARGGSPIPWHQDGGSFWGLDRAPILQIWTAIDDAPVDGGCVEVVPGSHRDGLATPLGGVIPSEIIEARDAESRAVRLPARAGEVLLIDNHVWHRSAKGREGQPRRAFTVCYLDAETRCLRKRRAPREFVRLFT